jgi:Lipase (class 3)
MYNDDKSGLVHLLDLTIFAYHLHSQTLVWPFDPYYEQLVRSFGDQLIKASRRDAFMRQVRTNADQGVYVNLHGPGGINGGPGRINRWGTNPTLDPIISDYNMIDPWRPSVTRPWAETEGWILYDTPPAITHRISTVRIVSYDPTGPAPPPPDGGPLPVVVQAAIPNLVRPAILPVGTDLLYCFEGATGGIERPDFTTFPAWSMMGFVLARQDTTVVPPPAVPQPYDVYIAFRGSRSGDKRQTKAFNSESGNPDWVTDMDFGLKETRSVPQISTIGKVASGFAASVRTMLPTIMHCLQDISVQKNGLPPRTIYVTGHSMGASLAVHFTSAVLLGTTYRHNAPIVAVPSMPANIRHWPWTSIKLVPFALPVVGDEVFQQAFDITLPSETVELEGDPVAQRRRGYAVGLTYTISAGWFEIPPLGPRHEPFNIRKCLIKDLQNKGLLCTPWPPAGVPDRPPWDVFQNFKQLIWSQPQANRVSDILGPDFNRRLIFYLDVLDKVVPAETQGKVAILRKTVFRINAGPYVPWGPPPMSRDTLLQIYKDNSDIYDANFAHFIAVCLFLSIASNTTFTEAHTNGVETPPFKKLMLQ